MNNFFDLINKIFNNRIEKVNLLNQKINLINSNHYHNIDWIILCVIFKENNILSEQVTSISSINSNKSLEDYVFKFAGSITIDRKTGKINNLMKQMVKFKNENVNKYIICFFEGIALNHFFNNNYINDPKYGIFNEFSKIMKGKFFNDLTLIYLYKNKLIDPKDKFFILKLLSPECIIKVKNYQYKFPEDNNEEFLKNIYLIKKNLINNFVK